jgi:hypothetical protein
MSAREEFLRDYSRAVLDNSASIFVGAGTSMAAGYPSWKGLLREIADELKMELEDFDDLAAVAQWSMQAAGASRTRVSQAILDEIGPDHDIPKALEVIARLPVNNLWTTNYDTLLERALASISRPFDVKAQQSQLSLKSRVPGAVKIYKMHGSIDDPDNLVIATDDYELYNKNRGAFLQLLEASMMSQTFLYTGVSLTDPNIRHVLSAIRQRFPLSPPRHFLITKKPNRSDFHSDDAYEARLTRHGYWSEDLKRYGFKVIEVDSYLAIDDLLIDLEKRIAKKRVWISGSWIEGHPSSGTVQISTASESIGHLVATLQMTMVSGSGLVVGPASIKGFLNGLQESGTWDLERRFIVRPFPQPSPGAPPNMEQWNLLRDEMARLSGTMIILGGLKRDKNGHIVKANGVVEELKRAQSKGSFIIPIGAFGGVAADVAKDLIGSAIPYRGDKMARPTDAELAELANDKIDLPSMTKIVRDIINRVK